MADTQVDGRYPVCNLFSRDETANTVQSRIFSFLEWVSTAAQCLFWACDRLCLRRGNCCPQVSLHVWSRGNTALVRRWLTFVYWPRGPRVLVCVSINGAPNCRGGVTPQLMGSLSLSLRKSTDSRGITGTCLEHEEE